MLPACISALSPSTRAHKQTRTQTIRTQTINIWQAKSAVSDAAQVAEGVDNGVCVWKFRYFLLSSKWVGSSRVGETSAREWSRGGEMSRGTFRSKNSTLAYTDMDTACGNVLFSSFFPYLTPFLSPRSPPIVCSCAFSSYVRSWISLFLPSLPLCVCVRVFGILADTEGGHRRKNSCRA